jgi:hypothetical protein
MRESGGNPRRMPERRALTQFVDHRSALGRSKKMNPYLTALKPLRKCQHLGNQLFAAALGKKEELP